VYAMPVLFLVLLMIAILTGVKRNLNFHLPFPDG
jgi:hypothetical protein